jgi:hypothetical protein
MPRKKVATSRTSCERRICAALELLKPPAAEKDKYRARINEWLGYIEGAREVAFTQKERNKYSTILKQLQAIGRLDKGRFLFTQAAINRPSIDLLAEEDKRYREGPIAYARRMGIEGPLGSLDPGYFAAAGAYELLRLRHRKAPGCSDHGDWYKLAQVLYGDDTNIYGWLREVKRVQAWMRERERLEQRG